MARPARGIPLLVALAGLVGGPLLAAADPPARVRAAASSMRLPLPEPEPEPAGGPPFDPDRIHPGCPEETTRSVRWLGRGTPGWSVSCQDAQGELHGPFVKRRADGSRLTRGPYREGERHGWWRYWDESGALASEDEWREGRRVARRRVGPDAGDPRPSTPQDPVHPCPAGSVVAGAAPPEGRRQWCELDRGDGAFVLHGPRMTWDGEGRPRKREEYREGVRHGTWVEWRDGRKVEEHRYVEGRLHGTSLSWHPDGSRACETEYERGTARRNACWDEEDHPTSETRRNARGELTGRTLYHPNGRKRVEESWKEGERTGPQREWWPNGQLRSQGRERDAGKTGTWRYWTPEGVLARVEHHRAGGRIETQTFVAYRYEGPGWVPKAPARGQARAPSGPPACPAGTRLAEREMGFGLGSVLAPEGEAAPDRALRALLDLVRVPAGRVQLCEREGQPHGPVVWHARGHRLLDGRYAEGEPAGTWTVWDGEGRRAGRVTHRHGHKARVVEWYPDGQARSLEHFDDQGHRHGLFATWYPNGALRLAGRHRHGESHGPWLRHKETGFRYERSEYRDGRKHGLWVEWQEGAGKTSEQEWREGVRHGRAARYRGGTLRVESQYRDDALHGPYREYHPDGSLAARGRYERGRRVGPWVDFHDSGHEAARGEYVWCEDPPSRSVARIGTARLSHRAGEGCKQGPWTYWREDGERIGTARHAEADAPEAPPARGAP